MVLLEPRVGETPLGCCWSHFCGQLLPSLSIPPGRQENQDGGREENHKDCEIKYGQGWQRGNECDNTGANKTVLQERGWTIYI